MALSNTKKKNIVADWKTGAFSLNKLAKKHKISVNTVKKICTGLAHDNAPLVKALYEVENLKKCTKSEQEIKAVENVVKIKLEVNDLSLKIFDKLNTKVDAGKAQKVVTVGLGDGVTRAEVVEYDYQPEHYEKLANTAHKLAQANGAIDSGNKLEINNQNQQAQSQQGFIIKVED